MKELQRDSHRVPVTPDALFNMRYPSDVNLSPDGKRVAFVLREWVPDQPKQRARIWVVETSDGEAQPFTKGPKADTCPRWSPDSQQLAFISEGEGEGSKGKAQLYLMPVGTQFVAPGEPKRVCTMPNGVSDLEWSPDGKRIAFLSLEGEEPKTDPLVVGPGRHNRLWTVRVDNDTPEPVTPAGVTVWEYAWSPDSRHFAIYYSTGPDENDWYLGQIGIVPAIGGAVRQVTHSTRQASGLAWSPDGTRLAYISGEWSDRCRGAGDIFVLPIFAEGQVRNLTPNIQCSPSWCQWFPDGRRLLFTAFAGVTHQIGILDEVDGTITTLVQDFVMDVMWPHLSTTPDLQAFATVHSDPNTPTDVWSGKFTFQGSTITELTRNRLTRLNPIAEETFAVVPSQRMRYESVDGWQIDALFTPPLEHKGDGAPPLIVVVHGGPSWAYSDSYDLFWTQMRASAGYAVLRPNIRGGWGRGVAFADAVVGDMGGKDLQDVLAGVEYLVEHGIVDGNRAGIMGWSYGGFMTAWAVTQTIRFKAAVMGAGVSDWHSFHAQSNLSVWDERFLGASLLERPEIYRECSAITYAARVRTPTLILHGESDEPVPVSQAYAFYRALREQNVPVELVVYPREGHGPSEREHLRDMGERMQRWFKEYL
jgi:dipeptidyl aminopeptidase/acylaminoacyl peptidase